MANEPDIKIDHDLGDEHSFMVKTPDGLVCIMRFPAVGTQVTVYEDPENNPVAYMTIRDKGV